MRQVLTDEISQAECALYRPFAPNKMLNDIGAKQAENFQPGTKMNLFLQSKSGPRPESVLAEALSTSGITETNVAMGLALKMEEDPRASVQSAVNMQNNLRQERLNAFQSGQPLNQIVEQQRDAEISRLKDQVRREQSMIVNQMNARFETEEDLENQEHMTQLMMEHKGDLRAVFSGLTGENPDSYKPGVFTKDDVVKGIKQRRTDLSEEDIVDAVGGLHADKVIDKLVNEMENEEKKQHRQRHTSKHQTSRKVGPDHLGDSVRRSGFAGMVGELFGTDRDF